MKTSNFILQKSSQYMLVGTEEYLSQNIWSLGVLTWGPPEYATGGLITVIWVC